jgi:hypothetical protein
MVAPSGQSRDGACAARAAKSYAQEASAGQTALMGARGPSGRGRRGTREARQPWSSLPKPALPADVRRPERRCGQRQDSLRAGAKPNDAQPKSGLTPLLIASAMGKRGGRPVASTMAPIPTRDSNGYAPLPRPCGIPITESTWKTKAPSWPCKVAFARRGSDLRIVAEQQRHAVEISAGANAFYGSARRSPSRKLFCRRHADRAGCRKSTTLT